MRYTSEVAAKYAEYRDANRDVVKALIEGAGITAKSRVLDVGCGTGNFCIALTEQAGCQCEGMDPSEGMLSQARERAAQIPFVQGQAESLPFPDLSFDLVFSVDVIHHVTDHAKYIGEASRVLKPGGRLCTVTESHEAIRLRSILSVYFPETVELQIGKYPSIESLSSLMAQAGFTEIREDLIKTPRLVTDISIYRSKAFSCLHSIPEEAYRQGLERLQSDLSNALPSGISGLERTTMLWGCK